MACVKLFTKLRNYEITKVCMHGKHGKTHTQIYMFELKTINESVSRNKSTQNLAENSYRHTNGHKIQSIVEMNALKDRRANGKNDNFRTKIVFLGFFFNFVESK